MKTISRILYWLFPKPKTFTALRQWPPEQPRAVDHYIHNEEGRIIGVVYKM